MKSKIIKYTISGISAIILGALGSATWEIVLRPLFNLATNALMELYGNFSDITYYYIAQSGHFVNSLSSRYIIIFLMVFFLYGPKRIKNILNSFFYKIPFLGMIMFAFFAFQLLSSTYYDSIANHTLQDIEIVAPYISDQEYKQLRSDFYSMDSKADYIELRESIDTIMEMNKIP